MKRIVIPTGDGSSTVWMPDLDETYHSRHGSVAESRHVFIHNGLEMVSRSRDQVTVLEVGFGTGLNAWLTLQYAREHGLHVDYHAIEVYPVEESILSALDYSQAFDSTDDPELFRVLHAAEWIPKAWTSPYMTLHKYAVTWQDFQAAVQADLIYFDAFAPRVQPELWTESVFRHLFELTAPGGILVTYCAKGEVRRNLRAAGWHTDRLPGPPGKREMTRASKPSPA